MNHPEWIAILDYGSQVTQLIARRIREQHVYCEILRYDTPATELHKRSPKGLFSLGVLAVFPIPIRLIAIRHYLISVFQYSVFVMECN